MFQLYKEKIVLLEDDEGISAMQGILAKYKKDDAVKLCLFIFLTVDTGDLNPIKDFPEFKRADIARKIVFGSSTFDIGKTYAGSNKLVAEAIIAYKKIKYNKIQQDINLYDKKIYQFIALLKENKPEILKNEHEVSGRISFSTNIDIISTVLDNSINIILDKAALVMLQKTGKFSSELRGKLSPNTKGKLKT